MHFMKPRHDKPHWKEVLSNWAVWAIIVGMAGHDWGIFILVTDLPKFRYAILHFDIGKVNYSRVFKLPTDYKKESFNNLNPLQNGYLYAMVFFSIWAVGNITGVLTDFIEKKKLIPTTLNRKIGTTIG